MGTFVDSEADGVLEANDAIGVEFDVESAVSETRLLGTEVSLSTVEVELVSIG